MRASRPKVPTRALSSTSRRSVLAVQKELKLRSEVLEDIRRTLEIYMDKAVS